MGLPPPSHAPPHSAQGLLAQCAHDRQARRLTRWQGALLTGDHSWIAGLSVSAVARRAPPPVAAAASAASSSDVPVPSSSSVPDSLLAPSTPIRPAPGKLTIALVGFGVFGQFLAKRMVLRGHRVIAWNKTPYPDTAKELGVEFYHDLNDLCEEHPEVVILVTSILSTGVVLDSLPIMRLKRSTLIVDVLSVKVFPKQLLLQKLPKELDILCTHPMFGPNSGSGSWKGLNFQYEKVRIYNDEPLRKARVERFLNFFADEGCNMVEMSCEAHDQAAASTQFVTHTVGRTLGTLKLQPTPIDTKGFEALLSLVNQTNTDSFDLYYGLFLYNQNATDELERLERGLESVKDRLFSQLHDVARRKVFPKSMLEKMLSKAGTKILKAFFRGLARQGKIALALSDSMSGGSLSSSSIDADFEIPRLRDHPQEILPLYRYMMLLWREKALISMKGAALASQDDEASTAALPHTVLPATSIMRDAFMFADIDGSGDLTIGELTARMLKLTNTRVSVQDMEFILKHSNKDFAGRITLRDMIIICAYEFFCSGSATPGCIDETSLLSAAQYLEFPVRYTNSETFEMMLEYLWSTQHAGADRQDPSQGLTAVSAMYRDMKKLGFLEAKQAVAA